MICRAVAATIVQIVVTFFPQGLDALQNPFISWTYALTTQFVEYLSIVTACGPYLKPLLENLSSGMMANDDLARRAGSYAQRSSKSGFAVRHKHRVSSAELRRLQPGAGVHETIIVATNRNADARSSHSLASSDQRSTRGFIRQTMSYQVTHEPLRISE